MIGKISVRQCLQASGYRGKGIGNPPGYRYDYNGGYDQQQDGALINSAQLVPGIGA